MLTALLSGEKLVATALGIEYGRIIARDIGGSDPERMAPGKVEEYLREVFNGTSIVMDVVAGHDAFKQDYPLFAAVDRCANEVELSVFHFIFMIRNNTAVDPHVRSLTVEQRKCNDGAKCLKELGINVSDIKCIEIVKLIPSG